ncbi:MAG TPA: hypothetical protein VHE80_10910, partial [Acidimicrobiales bacterium]|nr:hypothetical protein [Acidimicrobiales bacterium]
PPAAAPAADEPICRAVADELLCVAAWLEREAERIRLVRCDGELAWPRVRLPRLEPTAARTAG